MKKLFVFVLVVWLAGAYIFSLYAQNEWRSPRTMMEFSGNRIELFIRGLSWPLRIFGRDADSAGVASSSVAAIATQEQFSSAMCALTEMPASVREELRRAVRTYLQDRDQSKMVSAVEAEAVPFHLTKCFGTSAAQTMHTHTSREDFKHFYDASERALVLTLMLDAMRKMPNDQKLRELGDEARTEIQQRNEKYYR